MERHFPNAVNSIPESSQPSDWLTSVVPRRQHFLPQIGDEVVYLRQGMWVFYKLCSMKSVIISIAYRSRILRGHGKEKETFQITSP